MLFTKCSWKGVELTLLQRCMCLGASAINAEELSPAERWEKAKKILRENMDLKEEDETISIDEQKMTIIIISPDSNLNLMLINLLPYD